MPFIDRGSTRDESKLTVNIDDNPPADRWRDVIAGNCVSRKTIGMKQNFPRITEHILLWQLAFASGFYSSFKNENDKLTAQVGSHFRPRDLVKCQHLAFEYGNCFVCKRKTKKTDYLDTILLFNVQSTEDLSVFEGLRCGWQCLGRLLVAKWPVAVEILSPCTTSEPFRLPESVPLRRPLRSVCPAGRPLPAKPSIKIRCAMLGKKERKKLTHVHSNISFHSHFVCCFVSCYLSTCLDVLFLQTCLRGISHTQKKREKDLTRWLRTRTRWHTEELMATSLASILGLPFVFLRATFHARLMASIRRIL